MMAVSTGPSSQIGKGNEPTKGPLRAEFHQGVVRLQPQDHPGEQTHQHDDQHGARPDVVELSMIFNNCLGRKIFKNARVRKMVEAPRLSIQVITFRPVRAKGSASNRPGCAGLRLPCLTRGPSYSLLLCFCNHEPGHVNTGTGVKYKRSSINRASYRNCTAPFSFFFAHKTPVNPSLVPSFSFTQAHSCFAAVIR